MMQTTTFGQSGMTVSRLGLGMAALGRPGYINLGHAEDLAEQYDPASMQQRAATMLDLAWEQGVTYFDAARSYGRAEEFLARWLQSKQIPPAELVVGSKWGYTYTADWQVEADVHEVKQHTIEKLRSQWLESRELLGDQLDLYQIHSATLESGVLENRAVLDQLAELKQQGILIGLSVSGPRQAEVILQALQVQTGGQLLFDAVQATWNLLERSASSALQQAHTAGLGVIIKEGVANGRLTSRNQAESFQKSRKLLEAQASRLQTSIAALSLAGILAEPWVDIVLSGAASSEQLLDNLSATNVAFDEEAAAALQKICEAPETYWKTRSQLQWN